MVSTVLEPWLIVLLISITVLVMSFLMFLPAAVFVIWQMKRMPDISLSGTV